MTSPLWRPALMWLWVSISLCAYASLFACIPPSLCAIRLSVHVFSFVFLHVCLCVCVQMKQDVIYQSQIYNSSAQRWENTLVSVADEPDEQRRGVMWLLSILPGNYSTIYYQRWGGESCLVWGCKSGCWWERTRSERDIDRSPPSLECDLITVVLSDILPHPPNTHIHTHSCSQLFCTHLGVPFIVPSSLSEVSLEISAEMKLMVWHGVEVRSVTLITSLTVSVVCRSVGVFDCLQRCVGVKHDLAAVCMHSCVFLFRVETTWLQNISKSTYVHTWRTTSCLSMSHTEKQAYHHTTMILFTWIFELELEVHGRLFFLKH